MNKTLLFSSSMDIKMHIALLKQLASVDGNIEEAETNFINNAIEIYSRHIGVSKTEEILVGIDEISSQDIDVWKQKLKLCPVQARNLFKDLVTLGHVDLDFSNPEKEFVYKFASQIGIARTTAEQIAESVRQLMEATNNLNDLIFEEME